MLLVMLAYVGDGKKNVGEWRQIVSMRGHQLQLLNSRLLVARYSAQAHQPSDRCRQTSHQIPADTTGDMGVVVGGVYSQCLVRPNSRFLGEMQGNHVALVNQCCVVSLQAVNQGQREERIFVFCILRQPRLGNFLGLADRRCELRTYCGIRIQFRPVFKPLIQLKELRLEHAQAMELRKQRSCGVGSWAHGIVRVSLLVSCENVVRLVEIEAVEQLKSTVEGWY